MKGQSGRTHISARTAVLITLLLLALFLFLPKGHGKVDEAQDAESSDPKHLPLTEFVVEPEKGRNEQVLELDYTEANKDTPRYSGAPKWRSPTVIHELEKAVALVDYVLELNDLGVIYQPDEMKESARPIRSKVEAMKRYGEALRIYNLPTSLMGAAVEVVDYYLFAPCAGDYFNAIDRYLKEYPPEHHPVCDFTRGICVAIRKVDGCIVEYNSTLVQNCKKGIGLKRL